MLIAPILPMMSIYRLPHGQYGYRGHVINLPQDVASFTTSLPSHPNDFDIVIVRKQGSSETYRDFHVRCNILSPTMFTSVISPSMITIYPYCQKMVILQLLKRSCWTVMMIQLQTQVIHSIMTY